MSPSVAVASLKSYQEKPPISSGHIDNLLAKQGKADKLLLRRRVEFRLATQPDVKMDQLRKKYKAINETKGTKKTKKGTTTEDENSSSSSSSSGGDDDGESGGADPLVDSKSGFRRAPHSLFPAERLATEWRSVRPIGPGLHNLGNTCFLNSVLQCLVYTAPLSEYMLSREHSSSCRAGENCMLCRFETHVVRVLSKREGGSSPVSPKAIVGRLKLVAKRMRIGRQEDAHEFLRLLVESFQRSLLHGIDPRIDRRIQETTLAHQVFGGYLQSQVKCGRCSYESNTFDAFLDIQTEIHSGSSTLTKALRSYIRPEILSKDNRYRCEKCSKLVDAAKQLTVYQLPRILTLQLKRFSSFGGGKIGRYVEFPISLNMQRYVSANSPETGSFDYRLYAVLVHAGGTARSGHYYCFVKSSAGVWYEMNDSTVRQVSERTVLNQTAYLLFYERCPGSGELVPTKQAPKMADPLEPEMKNRKKINKHKTRTTEPSVPVATDDMEAMLEKAHRLELRNSETLDKRKKKHRAKHKVENENKFPVKESKSVVETSPKQKLESVVKIQSPVKEDSIAPVASEWVVKDKTTPSPSSQDKFAAAPVITWDEDTSSKRAKATAISENKKPNSEWNVSDVRLNRKSQYGAIVESWEGSNSIADETTTNGTRSSRHKDGTKKRHRRPDAYDAEYDRGRIKKTKKKHNKFASTINPFQMLGERNNRKKK